VSTIAFGVSCGVVTDCALATGGWLLTTAANVAVTERSPFITTSQDALPVHAPDQPENANPGPGAGTNPIVEPLAKSAEHVVEQMIPAGAETTEPVPEMFTVRCLRVAADWTVKALMLLSAGPTVPA
jgi:hypothetical protein